MALIPGVDSTLLNRLPKNKNKIFEHPTIKKFAFFSVFFVLFNDNSGTHYVNVAAFGTNKDIYFG
jgi:hypothetical protein